MSSYTALTAGNVMLPVVSEAAKEKEKRRMFGDESGNEEEDDEMCKKMWEYFGGLDFIFDG